MTGVAEMKAAVWLDTTDGLMGFTEKHYRWLAEATKGVAWRECADRDDFLRELADAEIAVCYEFKRAWLDRAKKLTYFSCPAAGRDWVEIRSRPGLEVTFGTFHGELIAETVLGYMLAFWRGIKASLDRRAGADPWPRAEVTRTMRTVRGSRATILGFGHIGKWIARQLKAMGVRIYGVNRSNLDRPDFFTAGDDVLALADLDRVLPETDHLIVVLPGEASSDRMVDSGRLALLPRGAFVYNVGRGNAIDEDGLVEALRSGRLGGAGLDVFREEPLPAASPLRACPNVILTPHVSAFSPEYMDLYARELLAHVARLFPGHMRG